MQATWKLVGGLVALIGCGAPVRRAAPVKSLPIQAVPAVAQARPARLDAVRPAPVSGARPAPLLDILTAELQRSFGALKPHADPPYFASYEAFEDSGIDLSASFGALDRAHDIQHRGADIDVRVGDYKLDNTHELRGGAGRFGRGHTISIVLPLDDDPLAIRSALWLATDEAYKRAAEQLQKVQANASINTASEDRSDDFSHETPSEYFEPPAHVEVDRASWEKRLRALSAKFRNYPAITSSSLELWTHAETRYFVDTEGTRFQVAHTHVRLMISAETIADDGMRLHRFEAFDVATPAELPTDAQVEAKIDQMAADLAALRKAPLAEPYLGPAILEGQAAGVFFHEVFGHRIEGHRQKSDEEGQTFAKKIGQRIMPDFIDVYDDPSIAQLDGRDLNGFYRYDDEGVPGRKASLVEHGILRTFLLGRSPTRGFDHSNGHGRRAEGRSVVSRQGNLIVAPTRTVDRATLQRMLLDEVKKQGKPYGLVFRQLDGGFTLTERFEPQSFKLLPVMVYRVYPDGREELIRGADLEGTPLRALADIVAAGDDVDTFNGFCGAESGYVPVSATSPSLLVAHVEVAKTPRSSQKPPLLPAPPLEGGAR